MINKVNSKGNVANDATKKEIRKQILSKHYGFKIKTESVSAILLGEDVKTVLKGNLQEDVVDALKHPNYKILNNKYVKTIQSYIKSPTEKKWDNIHGIILPNKKTIWQTWIAIDSSAPKSGKTVDSNNKKIKGWDKIPDSKIMKQILMRGAK